jgi:hypothetical protein
MPFLNAWLLWGLAAVSIPVIIHLLNRRRFETIDWGAMQFLQVSETVRRRLLIEELLLLLLRMGLIALLVLGMATPFLSGPAWGRVSQYVPGAVTQALNRPNRDLVLVIDGSARMSYSESGPSSADAAREWATAFLGELTAGDSVAVIQAREKPVTIIGEPTVDFEKVRKSLEKMPPPAGGCVWPESVREAIKILENSKRARRDIFLIGDGSRQGLADANSLEQWKFNVVPSLTKLRDTAPKISYVNIAPKRPEDPPNWALAPLRSSRAVTAKGATLAFRSAFELTGQTEYQPPHALRLEVDQRAPEKATLDAPASAKMEKGQVPWNFNYRFAEPGVHLVTVIVEPDPPGKHDRDRIPADNRQDFAVEVVNALPVLLVDGDPRPTRGPAVRSRGSKFLQAALAPEKDDAPVVVLKMISISEFTAASLNQSVNDDPGAKPRVLILANVASLTPEQDEAARRFLNDGGGILVTAGNRTDQRAYNDQLYRSGQGWLPAKLEEVVKNDGDPSLAAHPLTRNLSHPIVDVFDRWKKEKKGDILAELQFPRWWKLSMGKSQTVQPVISLTDTDPFLVAKPFSKGRVVLSAVPLDDTWGTNLTDTELSGAFLPLAREIVYYLAGARSAEFNLEKPGQPILYRPPGGTPAGKVLVYPPQGDPKPLTGEGSPLVFDGTGESGVYRVEDGGRSTYYVVHPESRQSLALTTDGDREALGKQVPINWESDRAKLALPSSDQPVELWGPFLWCVILLLCGEVWMTRRIALSR